jgi:diguanylate cyclase (GGDEF)-like protein/PAS domain S-box-containing protein
VRNADLHERLERAERWLVASENRYRLIVENANDGIWVLDAEGTTDFVNRRLCEMLGREPEELLGRSPAAFTDAAGAARLAEASRREGQRGYVELAFTHADGGALWIAISTSRYAAPRGAAQVHVVTDLTQRREMEERLRRAAERDRLTGTWNRGHFERLVQEALDDAGDERSVAVLFLDIDHFKYVNDALGHRAGDRLLQRIADLFGRVLREGDELARLGSDEFAVLLCGVDRQGASHAAERLLQVLRDERLRGMPKLSASAGVAVVDADEGPRLSAGDMLVAADIALHQAKQDGRDRHAIYTGDRGAFTWLGEIRDAIEEDRLVLYSQAIVPLDGGQRSEELLVRMVGRDGQLVPPAAFIPAAEEFGLIGEIDRWVVSQALALARLQRPVEVNLSAQSLGDECIRAAVEAAVADGVRPELLTFEITETAAARNLDVAREFSSALARLGCAFAIDDFGTGFGSLIYLRHLPIARVKIDMQFVRDMLSNPSDEKVVSAIVSTARAMGQETVAEGVEDAATLERLVEIGVDFAQGFHIERPRPVTFGAPEAPPRNRGGGDAQGVAVARVSRAAKRSPVILIVDDAEEILVVLEAIARRAGFEVVTAHDGHAAVEQLRAGLAPALVITDVEMPRMGGLELLQWIRESPGSSRTPVIIHSSLPEPATGEHDGVPSADAWVSKSDDPDRLLAEMRRLS